MASTAPAPPSLMRYPRWVLALTSLTAAYATYTLWTTFSTTDNRTPRTSGLHRRGAIRQHRYHSPHERQLSANIHTSTLPTTDTEDQSASPFGTITASVNDRQHVYQIGPNPPTRQQLQQNFGLSSATSRQVHADMQHVLLDIIIERLVETNAATMLIDAGPPYTHLMPLIPPLVERNIEDLLTNIDLLTEGPILPSAPDITREWRFDQANVALAFARRCGVDVERAHNSNVTLEDELDGLEDDIAETIIDSEHGGNAREPGQGIKGLLYTIAEEQAKRTAYIHRGTRCDSCGEFPIKGVRWHCINCPDYDLCSACESQSPSVHPRTHVFAKIKIPISTLAQPHQVHDLWYPGDPLRHWPPLKIILRKKLVSETGFEDVAMEALYEQFTCIANVAYPNDTTDIKAAIDRRAFNKAMSSDKWPAPLEPNFLFDRMFAFYDTDNNSLIGFEEFVHGLAYLRQPQASTYPFKKKDMKRLIKGYDVDGDGLVSRSDFVRMLSAKYAVQRHIIRDVVAAEEAEIVAHTSSVVRSSQPISAAFTGEDVPYGEQRTPALKTLDAFGDMQMAEGDTNVTLPDGGEIWDEETVNTVARRYGRTSDVVGQGQAFSMGHAQDVRSRYGRVEQVPVPQEGQHLSDDMVLVETDPRRNRGSADLEPAEVRWRTDLNDAISGGAGIPGFNLQDRQDEARDDGTDTTGVRANGRQEPSIPDSILDRNRAFPIPQSELPNTHSILYQVIQESINELLDPLFAESESLAYHVRSTREERQIWRENIDEYVTELAKLREEEQRLREVLRTGGAMDPLLGVADGVIRGQQQQARRRIPVRGRIVRAEDVESEQPNGSWSRQADSDNEHSEQRRSAAPSPAIGPNDASVNWTRRVNDIATARRAQVEEEAPSPESSDDDEMPSLMEQDSQFESRESPERRPSQSENFAAQLRQQIEAGTDMLPTDDEGLEDLEFNIRQQPLDELLAESGYSLTASASDSSLTNSILQSPRDETGAEQIYPRSSAASGTTVADIEHHGTSNNTEQEQASNENGLVDLTLPQHRPNTDAFLSLGATPSGLDHLTQIRNADEQESTLLSLPSLATPTSSTPFQMTDLPSSFQQITASVNELVHDIPSTIPARSSSPQNTNVDDKDGAPSRERLHYLHRLDEEERKILERGGPGRLDYDEVEEICSSEASGALIGLVCGWVEWAGF